MWIVCALPSRSAIAGAASAGKHAGAVSIGGEAASIGAGAARAIVGGAAEGEPAHAAKANSASAVWRAIETHVAPKHAHGARAAEGDREHTRRGEPRDRACRRGTRGAADDVGAAAPGPVRNMGSW
jgi:hypothetical protein